MANFTKPSVFGDDSDSDAEDRRMAKLGSLGPGDAQKRQTRIMQTRALEEDPTIFQYDELYDDMENKRKEAKITTKTAEEKKPKYIKTLLETAEKRKREYERRIERQVQKERDAEGEMYKDKESFVTSAYKQKLEEMQQAEEEEKRAEYLESIGDVTKQGNLDGFYRHLYEQKVGPEENKVKKEQPEASGSKVSKPERQYRKRKSNDEEEQPDIIEETVTEKSHLQSNLDADSDFSIDSDSSDDSEKEGEVAKETKSADKTLPAKSDSMIIPPTISTTSDEKSELKIKSEKPIEKLDTLVEKKPKIDIWAKRTVGQVFDAAVQRYFARKSTRSG